MNKPLQISNIFTATDDENNLSILYFDQNLDYIFAINTDYGPTITIFFMKPEYGQISHLLPFVHRTNLYPETRLEQIVCRVPEGKNFFEEDFTAFNEYFGFEPSKDFKFSM